MKNIFKLMGIALMACSLMVACNKDDDSSTDNPTPNPNPNPNPTPTSSVTITWGGAAQTTSFIDGFQLSANNTLFELEAAKGLSNDNYEFPMFRVGLDLDDNPQYGCALTAQYTYGEDKISGNDICPTDVIEEGYYTSTNAYNQIAGDWRLNIYKQGVNFQLTDAQYDATTLTLTSTVNVEMYSFADMAAEIQALGENYTEDDVQTAFDNARKQNLTVAFQNFKFEAASASKGAQMKKN